jgi:hypothetical protein
MIKKISVEHAVRWLVHEKLSARLELADPEDGGAVNLVVCDGDAIMGRLEISGGYLEEGLSGMLTMLNFVEAGGGKTHLPRSAIN